MKDDVGHERTPSERLRVFLCHSNDDKPQVRELYQRLRDDRLQPWLDEVDILVGQDWDGEIKKAVRASHVVIVCLSEGSVSKAGYVQREISFALEVAEEQPEGKIFILPVRLETCEIPRRLQDKQCASLFEGGGYARLKKALGVCASDNGLLPPEPATDDDTWCVSTNKKGYAGSVPRKPEVVAVRPRPSPRPSRPRGDGSSGNKKKLSKTLPLAGAVILVLVALILILSVSSGRGEEAIALPADNSTVKNLVPTEPVRPAPVLQTEPGPEKTPEQPSPTPTPTPAPTPTPTPTPTKVQLEARQVEGENHAPPVSPDAATPPASKPPSGLNRYRIDVFLLSNPSRRQSLFARDIERRLGQHVGMVNERDEPFKAVKGCQILYFYAGEDDARNEDAVAQALKKELNNLYPNTKFDLIKVSNEKSVTPNILSLVIGHGCGR